MKNLLNNPDIASIINSNDELKSEILNYISLSSCITFFIVISTVIFLCMVFHGYYKSYLDDDEAYNMSFLFITLDELLAQNAKSPFYKTEVYIYNRARRYYTIMIIFAALALLLVIAQHFVNVTHPNAYILTALTK